MRGKCYVMKMDLQKLYNVDRAGKGYEMEMGLYKLYEVDKVIKNNESYPMKRNDSWFRVWIQCVGKHGMFCEFNSCIWFYPL